MRDLSVMVAAVGDAHRPVLPTANATSKLRSDSLGGYDAESKRS